MIIPPYLLLMYILYIVQSVHKDVSIKYNSVFSWGGCKERPLLKDIELHTTDTKHMMILAVACGELKKENEKVKQEMATVREGLKKENDKIKEELGEVKEENKRIKANIHHVIASNSYQVLPITITPKSGVIHFYTDVCGHHMSARLSIFEVIGQGKRGSIHQLIFTCCFSQRSI